MFRHALVIAATELGLGWTRHLQCNQPQNRPSKTRGRASFIVSTLETKKKVKQNESKSLEEENKRQQTNGAPDPPNGAVSTRHERVTIDGI